MCNNLTRFIKAQENSYEQALHEIISGNKRSHWMWYIFPQFVGLGSSDTSKFYGIKNLKEAKEYLDHSTLGLRLKEITCELLRLENTDANRIFGSIDALKLKSCMTLFSVADDADDNIFKRVIEKYYHNSFDKKTLELIKNAAN